MAKDVYSVDTVDVSGSHVSPDGYESAKQDETAAGCCTVMLTDCPLSPPPDGTEYGLSEADMEASYATLKSMAEQIEADVILLREHQEAGGKVQDYLVRKRVGDNDFLEVR